MANNDTNYVQIPRWIANTIFTAFVIWAMGATALLYSTHTDVKLLKTALVAKGIIEHGVCQTPPDPAKMRLSGDIRGDRSYQNNRSRQKKL